MSAYGDLLLMLATGFGLGGVFGWWTRGRRTIEQDAHAARLQVMFDEIAQPASFEAKRRARLAYDTIYDERHPEEWS